jgi:hypothetical protein
VQDAGVVARALQAPAKVHKAAGVAGDQGVSPALLQGLYLLVSHRGRDVGHLDGERPPEPATELLVLPLYELQSLDVPQQLPRLLEHAKLPPLVAPRVEDRLPRVPGTEVLHPQHVHKEVRELPDAMSESLGAFPFVRHIVHQERVVVGDHGGARSGRAHDVVPALTLEDVEEVAGEAAGLVEETGVEGRLAAAGLPLGVDDLDAKFP